MRFIPMRELKINPSAVLNRLGREDMVVTRNGKPAAVLLGLDEDTLEDYMISRNPLFTKELEAAYSEYETKGGISHAEMRKRLGKRRG